MKAPEIESWVDTVKQLVKKGWLVKIVDKDRGISIYQITGKGLEAYEIICYLLREKKLYGGPTCRLISNQPMPSIPELEQLQTDPRDLDHDSKPVKKLYADDLLLKQFDYQTALTPKGAEHIAVLWFVNNKDIRNVTKLQKMLDLDKEKELEKSKPKDKRKPKVNKVAEISMKVIKGTNQVGKMMGDMSKAMDKMGTSMGGNFGTSSKRKGKKKTNEYADEYTKLGKKMMDGSGF